MPKVTIVQVVYNNRQWIEPVFSAIFSQTFKDFKVVVVIAGNEDGSKELLASKFSDVEIIDPGYNIGFAKGHNLVFEKYCNPSLTLPIKGREGEDAEFFQLVNPDMIMEPNYIEEMLKVFSDEKVGAATGKLCRIRNYELGIMNEYHPFNSPPKIGGEREYKILDTTGVVISKSGRARDRGQHEEDKGQYDALVNVDAVSGAGAMYRATALWAVKFQISNFKFQKKSKILDQKPEINFKYPSLPTRYEYFDEDFHSYWEDVDLSWRMANKGWKNVFVPLAVGFHGRAAGSSRGGYLHVIDFIKYHRNLPERIRRLNYKNHILMYIKNSKYLYPQFFVREFFMLIYILLFEASTLKVLPELFKQLPKIWKKRKLIYKK